MSLCCHNLSMSNPFNTMTYDGTIYFIGINRQPCITRTADKKHLFGQLCLNMFIQHFLSANAKIQVKTREKYYAKHVYVQ